MKAKIYFKRFLFLIMGIYLLILPACNKNNDSLIEDPEIEVSEIDVFIWNGLRQYYLWVDDVPNLVDPLFNDESQLAQFLNTYDDHEELFTDLLYRYGEIDKWSWIVDDYVELENLFQGITTSMGFEYGLVRISNSENIFGYIQYIVPDSPADDEGLTRGEIFISIDGQTLTINNYRELLFGRDAFAISFADIVDNTITPNGKTVDLTAVVLHENPIHFSQIIDVDGTKVAYLVYNGFISTYDFDLNDLFGTYKTEGVQELILDLRYNGGGSVRSATYLASMIYDTDTDLIFTRSQYNNLLQDYLLNEYGSSFFDNPLLNEIAATDNNPAAPINTLNLNRLYVLSTSGTASASELIINGLNPYMDVVIIGTNTHGKYVGSITIKDYDSNGKLNPNHKWAMQPVVFKTTNSEGVSDFVDGFAPAVLAKEDLSNILPFGDANEPLLKAATDHIRGIAPFAFTKSVWYYDFVDSKDLKPFGKDMYSDQKLK